MYWNSKDIDSVYARVAINRNMRCIEIWRKASGSRARRGLIETWDVLK